MIPRQRRPKKPSAAGAVSPDPEHVERDDFLERGTLDAHAHGEQGGQDETSRGADLVGTTAHGERQ